MKVLLINLTRFGDLIQTQPVITGMKSRGHEVGLVCLKNFASAATLLDGVDHVFPFPGSGLLAGLDSDWRLAVRDLAGFRDGVFKDFPPDTTVNLTPSVSSRMLTYALTPETGSAVGFTVDQFGFNADTSSWAAFLQMAGANRGASPFNVCDLFRRAAGLDHEGNSLVLAQPGNTALSTADALLGPDSGNGFAALQMGASEDRRRWPVEYFVETARMLHERDGVVPVLLGTENERPLGERFAAMAEFPFVDCQGRTSLSELAGVLTRCRLLLTNDTGTMHLAAGLGVPMCAVFLATAQPWDTGPYRAGSICLEPDLDCHPCEFGAACPHEHVCRRSVKPETMYACARMQLSGEAGSAPEGARVWQTVIGQDGLMTLVPLSAHETGRTAWIGMQRHHFSRFLNGDSLDSLSGLGGKIPPETSGEISKTLTSATDMLFLLMQQGMLLTKNPRPAAKTKFLASWQRLQTILISSERLKIIALLWVFETQRFGDDLGSLLALAQRYHALLSSLRNEFT